MPPLPRRETISYGPSRVLGVSVKGERGGYTSFALRLRDHLQLAGAPDRGDGEGQHAHFIFRHVRAAPPLLPHHADDPAEATHVFVRGGDDHLARPAYRAHVIKFI